MWILVVVVAVVVVAIVVAGRQGGAEGGPLVTAVGRDGLQVDGVDGAEDGVWVVGWRSIHEIAVVSRRQLGGTWFGFEIRSDDVAGLLMLSGPGGLGEAFLAESHRFAGFDHEALHHTLTRRSNRSVCYRR